LLFSVSMNLFSKGNGKSYREIPVSLRWND
jgi:hypothetical protein